MQQTAKVTIQSRPSGLRRFIVGWVSVLVCGFILLGGGLSFSISRLHHQTARMYFDSQSLQTNHLLEADALAAGRLALLDQQEGSLKRLAEREAFLREGKKALSKLQSQAQNDTEKVLANKIGHSFREFEDGLHQPGATEQTQQALLDQLLNNLHTHRTLQQQQMDDTMTSSMRLDLLIDNWAKALLISSTLILVAGVAELWKRIFRPALELDKAAYAFGNGDLQARARVRHDDEMGRLNETFNVMAQAICNREKERLHFVATVAHDLKNPLVVIGGAAHLLEKKSEVLTPKTENAGSKASRAVRSKWKTSSPI